MVSGSGSDMQSVIDGCKSGQIDGQVVCVVSNKADVYALTRAENEHIPSQVFSLQQYDADAERRDEAIAEYLQSMRVDLVVLAGYLSILTPALVARYRGRMINIHPSLIPRHCGKGMYGLRVHRSVIDSGDTVSGATVHYVDEGADTGEIIAQVQVPVLDGDTPESLQARVLEQEHILLPRVVAQLCKTLA